MKHNAVDMTGKRIGYVTVLEYAGTSRLAGAWDGHPSRC